MCQLAKFHHLPFPRSEIMSKSSFDLIHMDLWGSYHVSPRIGEHYFLVFMDDCTSST